MEEVLISLRIGVTEAIYSRCIDELRSVREGKFDSVSQSLENLRAPVHKLHWQLVLVEN